MEYDNIIETLLFRFPELRNDYEENKDYLEGLPYGVYEDIFMHYVVKMCKDTNTDKLKEISIFLEEMAQSEDDLVNNLFGVAIIESLYYDQDTLKILKPYLKEKTLKELNHTDMCFKNDKKLTSKELFDLELEYLKTKNL